MSEIVVTMTLADGRRASAKTKRLDFDWRTDPAFAVELPAPTGSLKVAALADHGGSGHSCAIMSDQTARCWGLNTDGRLGDGSTASRKRPVTVVGNDGTSLKGVIALSLSSTVTCAVASKRTYCFGGGQILAPLGSSPRATAPEIPGLGEAQSVSLGNQHACALLTSSEVQCWGENSSGQLGDGTTTDRGMPVYVVSESGSGRLTGVDALSVGALTTCVLKRDESVLCWGNNAYGSVGDGTTQRRAVPTQVSGLGSASGVTQISAGRGYYVSSEGAIRYYDAPCARKGDGNAFCWGPNPFGQLGDGTTTNRTTPVKVLRDDDQNGTVDGDLRDVVQIFTGSLYACAILADRTARCWGAAGQGSLGDGERKERRLPAVVRDSAGAGPLHGVVSLSLGHTYHSISTRPTTLALLEDGTLRAWGDNNHGQIGDGTNTPRLLPVTVLLP